MLFYLCTSWQGEGRETSSTYMYMYLTDVVGHIKGWLISNMMMLKCCTVFNYLVRYVKLGVLLNFQNNQEYFSYGQYFS